ncbi:immunoglobulin superfamily member 10-like [Nematolebias whitei]|uniref:immunoglobulin superfamily member 10-like n=1 Tax=Nematolebias whitei TaxID=451745 RepID=UPI00189AFC8E|nr:immunoglobulin superfamily member 10-like [Nematolebias whitei]
MECFLYSFFTFGGFLKGVTAVIQTHPNVAAAAGEDARLFCQLLETTMVYQVTWQKIFEGKEINIGSYEKFNGETVNLEFEGKVQFKEAGLQNNSIVIRNVTEQDGGCYLCVFTTYPHGGLSNKTCVHVYELHEPVLQVRRSKSPEESLVSCSATGRPAPTVTLTAPQQHLHLSQHNTVTVTNTNNTVTVTTTAVLSGLHDDSFQDTYIQVACAAKVDFGPQVEVVKRITELRPTSDDAGLAAVIQTQLSVWATTGGDVLLSCQLLENNGFKTNLIQVSWEKSSPAGSVNMAAYNPHFGARVNPDFRKNVQFEYLGLQNNSVVIRNVTEQDGGCYLCVFTTYPHGGLSNKTCVHVYELHEPVLQVRGSKSPEESLVSCSATGRPAPTVTLTVPQQHLHLSQHNTVTVTNTNNTVTVTTTAVLSGLHDDSTRVGCAARVDSGPQVEVVKRISLFNNAPRCFHLTWVTSLCTSVFVSLLIIF